MKKALFFSVLVCLLLTGCWRHNEPWEKLTDDDQELYFVNQFGASMMSTYYLWNKEVEKDLGTWRYDSDPLAKTREVRYKDAAGNEIDRWTQMTDDYDGFRGLVTGDTKSSGLEYTLYYADEAKQDIDMVVTYTYADSPAALAGLKRGDVVVAINSTPLTANNYKTLLGALNSGNNCTLGMKDGSVRTLTAKDMYLDPVHTHKVIEKDGRKIGYLHYTSYTQKSIPDLVEVFKGFTAAGITELVLDLRYNGGGYSNTAEALASMVVPRKEVDDESVFQRDIYNEKLTAAWEEEIAKFGTTFKYEDEDGKHEVSTVGANPDVSKLYVIMTQNTASASEATVWGLLPYMDIQLIGERSHGKYYGGIIVDAPTFFGWVKDELGTKTYTAAARLSDNWGIYVMVSRYADKDGNTPCMPDGFAPDLPVQDNPLDGFELGDENETMLSVVLNGLPDKARASVKLKDKPLYTSHHPEVRIITPRNIFGK